MLYNVHSKTCITTHKQCTYPSSLLAYYKNLLLQEKVYGTINLSGVSSQCLMEGNTKPFWHLPALPGSCTAP